MNDYAYPAPGMMRGGKMNGVKLISMLNYLRAHQGDMFRTKTTLKRTYTRKGQSFFVVRPQDISPYSKLRPGVYERFDLGGQSTMTALFFIVSKAPHHKAKYDFYGIGQAYVNQQLGVDVRQKINNALHGTLDADI
jgi:hypothetical protein